MARKYAMPNQKTIFLFPNGIRETLGLGQVGLASKDNNIPKAYINYLFFDKEGTFKKGGFKQVSEAALGSFEELSLEYFPEEEGTMMIYTANQTAEDLDVYIDDMAILHTEGPIIRVDDHYPFGLTFNTSERSGYLTNNYLFNSKEKQELTDWYDYGARMYDASIGRWHVVDPLASSYSNLTPYNYAENNPLRFIDVLGMNSSDTVKTDTNNPGDSKERGVTVTTTNEDDDPKNEESEGSNIKKESTEWLVGVPLIGGEANGQSTGYTAKLEIWFDYDWINVLSKWIARNKLTNKDKKNLTYERNKGQNSQGSMNDKAEQVIVGQDDLPDKSVNGSDADSVIRIYYNDFDINDIPQDTIIKKEHKRYNRGRIIKYIDN
jgi:RHS repeat-associated protein